MRRTKNTRQEKDWQIQLGEEGSTISYRQCKNQQLATRKEENLSTNKAI